MSRLLAVFASLLLLAAPAAASIVRVDLTKASQATSPVQFTLRTATSNGFITVAVRRVN
jgi:hypothetical protein